MFCYAFAMDLLVFATIFYRNSAEIRRTTRDGRTDKKGLEKRYVMLFFLILPYETLYAQNLILVNLILVISFGLLVITRYGTMRF